MTDRVTQSRPRLLLVDDDPSLLDLYRELLGQLPSQPEIFTAHSGARALAMLEAEPFRLLVCDLKMPKLDGLQVLSIVRRKYPELRTVALTAVVDEQFRSRVYALGVDLFWHKPNTEQETSMFLECLESLLGQETDSGFRGLQSKSLVDIVQLECLSQSSSVLRISNGPLTARIWIQDGDIIDSEAGELHGEEAFRKILSWRAGAFETLPAEPSRARTIFKPYNGLLLESAQAIDESQALAPVEAEPVQPASPVGRLAQITAVEFVLAMKADEAEPPEARGLENPQRMAAWARRSLAQFRALGDRLQAGPLQHLEGFGPQRHVALTSQEGTDYCVGWVPSVAPEIMGVQMRKVLTSWAS